MKKIIKNIVVVFIVGITFNSCETTTLNITEDPNALTPSQANPDFYLNGAQERFARVVEELGEAGAQVTRIENMNTRNYQNAYSPSFFDETWERAYQEVIKNIRDMNVLAEESNLNYHIGMGKFMEAYTISILVDYFGDIPYSEATSAPDILNPKLDSGEEVYLSAIALLDEAIVNFNTTSSALPANDFFYDGDASNWIKACNTLKLRLYLNMGDLTDFNAIISSGDYIQNSSDDLEFSWGSNAVQPDTRHPYYGTNYTNSGAVDYQSIWLMDLMNTTEDPRSRYYFYRQNERTPGSVGVAADEVTLACSVTSAPAHYVTGGYAYCSLPDGFWGRNHGNDEGTPPDGLLRTAPGVYPAAGKFDDDSFSEIALGAGGGGAGITPMLLASSVDFWRAETLINSDPAIAKTFMIAGIEKSITKVQSFGSLDTAADFSLAPSTADTNSFVLTIGTLFDDAEGTDKWNVIAEQFFVSLKGNGHDSFNFYRRTGYPNNIEPNLEPDPGAFIRSFFYPAIASSNNQFVVQKSGVAEQVFWDTNPAFPSFPAAN
ncbi:SusD/RagB family nutrient-binding outer membrane lipoprotein [Cellulophaga sp. E16_2]|uniref:SusD/RagB family nutrient-binding outer membrane lipoprotein n=1 Tax=Cellulophaga sp. E16_2 TaxID=2789297 RepID=UPI001A922E9C|nr:SusD/RagB family nutrient-binding outer membrane lipoprotein [Cellulophaga sp. E16_2]MBO0590427.1 SusD/RagB family nutrient-binding outer membrane lipoprotein [Cellulophaga sp. E16_2]